MPYLNVDGPQPKIGKPFAAFLDDTGGRTCLPVTAELVSDRWIKIGADDWRSVLSCRAVNGTIYFGITTSRLGIAEQQRARRVSEAVQAGRKLQTALTKLDATDAGRARCWIASYSAGSRLRKPRADGEPSYAEPLVRRYRPWRGSGHWCYATRYDATP